MKPKVGIDIATPCNESWETMTQDEKGRFCASCSKTVYDVSGWSKENIIEAYHEEKEELCIRIPSEQLDKYRQVSPQPLRWAKGILLAVMIFIHKLPIAKAWVNMSEENNRASENQPQIRQMVVKGMVLDSALNNQPVSYATILILHANDVIGTAFTDVEGKFQCSINDITADMDTLTIECSHLSYASFTAEFVVHDEVNMDVFLKESSLSLRTVVIQRGRNTTGPIIITMGGMMMGAMRSVQYRPLLDPYDTKTYYQDDLQRLNLNR